MDDRQQLSARLHIDPVDRGRAAAGLPFRRAGEIRRKVKAAGDVADAKSKP